MGISNNMQEVDGPNTIPVSLWKGSHHANGIHCTPFMNSNDNRHGRPRGFAREDYATGRT